jgi:hypothetical protein
MGLKADTDAKQLGLVVYVQDSNTILGFSVASKVAIRKIAPAAKEF